MTNEPQRTSAGRLVYGQPPEGIDLNVTTNIGISGVHEVTATPLAMFDSLLFIRFAEL